jgi:glyoxylase-like metal-dependent hydrolase (beta-lactamase superfamily II)
MQALRPIFSPDDSRRSGTMTTAGADKLSGRCSDRRAVLAGLGAALAAPHFRIDPVFAALPAFRYAVGSIELTVVSDGALSVPLSFSLPEIPPLEAAAFLASRGLPAAGRPIPTNVTLVKSGSELIVVDAGSGANFQPTAGKLAENLEAEGIEPAGVTKVVFTHGHADHLWGAIDDFDDTERFANATYVMSAQEWDFWLDPDTRSRAPDWLKGMALASARILKRLERKIERRRNDEEIATGLRYVETAGHTPGHMSVMLESGRERLLIGADALSHAAVSFARPDWRWGSDYDSDRAVATRRRLLDQLATDRIPLIGFHVPWPGHGMVERSGSAYRFAPL